MAHERRAARMPTPSIITSAGAIPRMEYESISMAAARGASYGEPVDPTGHFAVAPLHLNVPVDVLALVR